MKNYKELHTWQKGIEIGSAFEVQTYLVIANELNWAKQEDIIVVGILLEE